jgi:fructokinase
MRIGIDLGGTKTEIVALQEHGVELFRHREGTPAHDYEAILESVARLVALAESAAGEAQSIGIATPGAISPRTGLLKNSNTLVLNGRAVDRDLSRRLGRPVRLENDANCLALSEAIDGAAAGARVVFAAILGTGVGGGVVVDQRLLAGRNRIAGEWGHNPLPWAREEELAGHTCYCGKVGCIETFLSGTGLARDYLARSGSHRSAHQISHAAASGESEAGACLHIYKDRLARGLASVVNLLDPDAVVLGGGLSNIAQLYPGLPQLIASYAFSDGLDMVVVPALHGDSSGVRGAARLWG